MGPERGIQKQLSMTQGASGEGGTQELFDADCLKLINEYFYGVRVFPGQDPTHVYVGWVTTQYHYFSNEFNQSKVRKASVTLVDDYDNIMEQ